MTPAAARAHQVALAARLALAGHAADAAAVASTPAAAFARSLAAAFQAAGADAAEFAADHVAANSKVTGKAGYISSGGQFRTQLPAGASTGTKPEAKAAGSAAATPHRDILEAFDSRGHGNAEPFDKLYERAKAARPDLTPEQFKATLADLKEKGHLRLTAWPKGLSDIPRPELGLPHGETGRAYYASTPGGFVGEKTLPGYESKNPAVKPAAPDAKPKAAAHDAIAARYAAGEAVHPQDWRNAFPHLTDAQIGEGIDKLAEAEKIKLPSHDGELRTRNKADTDWDHLPGPGGYKIGGSIVRPNQTLTAADVAEAFKGLPAAETKPEPAKPAAKATPKPAAAKPTPAAAKKAASQAAVAGVVGSLKAGTPVSAADLAALPGHLANLTVPEIKAVAGQLGAGKHKLKAAQLDAVVAAARVKADAKPEPAKPEAKPAEEKPKAEAPKATPVAKPAAKVAAPKAAGAKNADPDAGKATLAAPDYSKDFEPGPKVRKAIADAYDELKTFAEVRNSGGLAPNKWLYGEAKRHVPELTEAAFKSALFRMGVDRHVENHVLNEVSQTPDAEKSASPEVNGRVYHWTRMLPDQRENAASKVKELEAAAVKPAVKSAPTQAKAKSAPTQAKAKPARPRKAKS